MSEDIIGYEHKEWTDLYKDLLIFQILFDIISLSILKFSLNYSFGQKRQSFSNRENCAYSNTDFTKGYHIMPFRVLLKGQKVTTRYDVRGICERN